MSIASTRVADKVGKSGPLYLRTPIGTGDDGLNDVVVDNPDYIVSGTIVATLERTEKT